MSSSPFGLWISCIIIVYERLPLSSLNEFYIDHERVPFGALDYNYIYCLQAFFFALLGSAL